MYLFNFAALAVIAGGLVDALPVAAPAQENIPGLPGNSVTYVGSPVVEKRAEVPRAKRFQSWADWYKQREQARKELYAKNGWKFVPEPDPFAGQQGPNFKILHVNEQGEPIAGPAQGGEGGQEGQTEEQPQNQPDQP